MRILLNIVSGLRVTARFLSVVSSRTAVFVWIVWRYCLITIAKRHLMQYANHGPSGVYLYILQIDPYGIDQTVIFPCHARLAADGSTELTIDQR